MISEAEIVSTLAPLNGTSFDVPNLPEYASKITKLAKSVCFRDEDTNELQSYVFYYDNEPEVFITVVWTGPRFRGRGLARQLITKVIHSTYKNVSLEVRKDNPAMYVYERLKFVTTEDRGARLLMSYQQRLAIMQPYTFPYIGYFHLIEASSLIVFNDDVNYIKGGWINRNRILVQDKAYLFTVPIKHVSSERSINETWPSISRNWLDTFSKQLKHSYGKAPHFADLADRLIAVFAIEYSDVTDLAINSIVATYDYLGLPLNYTKASTCSPETRGMEKADRLIAMTRKLGFARYVNAPGGAALYSKDYFRAKGVELGFVKSNYIEYRQFKNEFVPWLSIIDVLMFNDRKTVADFFTAYTIE
jgi:WbqC-like protein family/Acetyltransferase (GNAT) family